MGGGREPQRWQVTAEFSNFKVKWPTNCHKNIAKYMAYISWGNKWNRPRFGVTLSLVYQIPVTLVENFCRSWLW